jgi:hypothetical protein
MAHPIVEPTMVLQHTHAVGHQDRPSHHWQPEPLLHLLPSAAPPARTRAQHDTPNSAAIDQNKSDHGLHAIGSTKERQAAHFQGCRKTRGTECQSPRVRFPQTPVHFQGCHSSPSTPATPRLINQEPTIAQSTAPMHRQRVAAATPIRWRLHSIIPQR